MIISRFPTAGVALLLRAGLLGGCATRKIDWSARVGTYTFDQAVVEIGPPEKQAKLTDDTLVAEWLTRRGYRQVYATGGFYGSPYGAMAYPPPVVDTYSPDYFLRLTFGPDGRLLTWKKLIR